uniref:Embryonic polarity protein dorsal n=1 Tax=Cacopsylla melanoneura TaxID=428564 RepID=A0A8D8TB71_9HEMI
MVRGVDQLHIELNPPVGDASSRLPSVRFVNQPKSKIRFRYESEEHTAGAVFGRLERSYPTIEIVNYDGPCNVIVSCVTVDSELEGPNPIRLHPNPIVSKGRHNTCINGFYEEAIHGNRRCTLDKLGIQKFKNKSLSKAELDRREPGVDHSYARNIDLYVVKLRIQVQLPYNARREAPILTDLSEPIFESKKYPDLKIEHLSHSSASVDGGLEMIILCDKIDAKDKVQVRFYEEKNGQFVWDVFVNIRTEDIHRQVAIKFKTPPYRDRHITVQVPVKVQLVNIRESSEPRSFLMIPRQRQDIKRPRTSDYFHALENNRDPDGIRREPQPGPSGSKAGTASSHQVYYFVEYRQQASPAPQHSQQVSLVPQYGQQASPASQHSQQVSPASQQAVHHSSLVYDSRSSELFFQTEEVFLTHESMDYS